MMVTPAHSGEDITPLASAPGARQSAKKPRTANSRAESETKQLSVTVALSPHQAMLLDEWISDHSAPRPSRAEALMLHFDWSIARCSSRLDEFPRTREPDFTTGKDSL